MVRRLLSELFGRFGFPTRKENKIVSHPGPAPASSKLPLLTEDLQRR